MRGVSADGQVSARLFSVQKLGNILFVYMYFIYLMRTNQPFILLTSKLICEIILRMHFKSEPLRTDQTIYSHKLVERMFIWMGLLLTNMTNNYINCLKTKLFTGKINNPQMTAFMLTSGSLLGIWLPYNCFVVPPPKKTQKTRTIR